MDPNLRLSLALRLLLLPCPLAPLLAQTAGAAPETAAAAPAVAPVVDAATAAAIRKEGIEKSQAMRLLRALTQMGHRLTGSDNFTKACDWAAAEFRRMGLANVREEKWGQWNLAWNRGAWIGRVTSPVQLDMYVATDAWTAGTKGLQRGPLVAAPADAAEAARMGDKLRGAFVFGFDPAQRGRNAEQQERLLALADKCRELGVLGFVYRARDPDAKYPQRVRVFGRHETAMLPLDQVPTVPQIAVRADHADTLKELLAAGKEVTVEFDIQNEFRQGPIALHNVIAEIVGAEKPDEVVIVCGHLDSWHQAQGCTDNGTGTTSTLEAARILAAVGARPARTIRFCLWGGEEQGLLGSAAYVRMHRAEMGKVSAVFNHDTGTNWAYALTVTDAMYEPMRAVVAPILALSAPDPDWDGPVFKLNRAAGLRGMGSDHASFLAAGVPGLDWSLRGRSDYFGYTWHTQWDTIDVAIEEYERHTSTVVALAALGTANLPALLDRTGMRAAGGGGGQAGTYAAALFDGEMDGFQFTKVDKGGRADKMGIREGDVLWKAGGVELEHMYQVFQIARELPLDQEALELELKRGNGTVKVQMPLKELREQLHRRGRGARGGDGNGAPRGGGGQPGGGQPGGGQQNGGGEVDAACALSCR